MRFNIFDRLLMVRVRLYFGENVLRHSCFINHTQKLLLTYLRTQNLRFHRVYHGVKKWIGCLGVPSKKMVEVRVMKILKYVEKYTKNILFYRISNILFGSWKFHWLLKTIFLEINKIRPIWGYSIKYNVKQ